MSEINLWEKYRNESKQTICIIGVLILAAKLCVADNHFSLDEEEEILKIIPHEPHQKRILMKILEESAEDKNSIKFHAERIKKLIGDDHQDFLEFIIAVLYRLAHSDHLYHDEEDKLIREVAKIFRVEKTYFDLFKEITIKFFKYKYFKKQNA
tara:strand:+ start:255 stop:713 length:459 start_codon:yes stop_codon:yes gene_type:complete